MANKIVNTLGNGGLMPPSMFQRNWAAALLAGAAGFTLGFFIALTLLWRPLPGLPALEAPARDYVSGAIAVGINHLMPFLFPDSAAATRHHLGQLASSGLLALLWVRAALAALAGIALGALMAKAAATPSNGLLHSRGRQLLEDRSAVGMANSYLKKQATSVGFDLKIHPEITFTLEQFTKHLLIMGAIGGGKTTIIMYLLHQLFARGDKALIFDVKGDFTSKFPDAALVAPWHKGGRPWLIGVDCSTRQDAREFATQVIPDSKDPMWAQAARQVLVGMIVHLQRTKKTAWGWLDLANLFAVSEEDLVEMMKSSNKEALRAVESANQTTTGILINMMAGLSWITDLAEAWGNPTREGGGISFVEWLFDDKTATRQIILQGNGRFEQMMQGYVSSIISMLSARINSPQFSDSRTRRLWFILDEFPQIGKVKYQPLIEVGRSKGVRVVIGIQDINQVTKVYSEQDSNALMSMIGTKIVAQIAPGETAKKVAELIGEREVERHNLSISGSGSGKSTTSMMNREQIKVVYDSELSSELGNRPEKGGIVALLINNDAPYVYMLTWPHDSSENRRESYIEADWVSGVADHEAAALTQVDDPGSNATGGTDKEDGAGKAAKERLRMQEEEAEFKRAAARAAARKLSDLLGPAVDGASDAEDGEVPMGARLIARRSDGPARDEDAEAAGSDRLQYSTSMARRHIDFALASSDLGGMGIRAASKDDEDGMGSEAAEALHGSEAMASTFGLDHGAQHALGLALLAPSIADALRSQAGAADPVEERRRRLADTRHRNPGALERWSE